MHVVIDKKQHQMDGSRCLSTDQPLVTSRSLRSPLAGFVLSNVLSKMECLNLRTQLQHHGLQYEFWNLEAPEKKDLRNAETLEVLDEGLAKQIWSRIESCVESSIVIGDDDDRFECGLAGTWIACGVNPVMLYGRYAEGCHFSPHSDGNNVLDFNNRSLYTVIIYLTDCPDGGSTNLFFRASCIRNR
jgi:leukotriene-A4 hydrolase